jgi:Family of unknown function (DUF5677)
MDQSHSAVDVAVNEAVESTTPAYQKLIDLEAFNKGFVQGLIIHLVQTKRSEECFLMSYHRAALNLSSMIALNNVKHFQAAAMLARSVLELAVEIRLIDLMPDAVLRMVAFQRLEKLKAAQKAIRFAANHTLQFATDLTSYNEFIKVHQTSIEAIATSLWGTLKVRHWSNRHLSEQVKLLGEPFEEIYHSLYKQLSWHVHAGLAGVANMKPEAFPYVFGVSCQIAALSFEEILKAVIRQFALSSAVPTIYKELEFATIRAGVKGNEKLEGALRQDLGLS